MSTEFRAQCPKCAGSKGGPAFAFINTGEDYTKHRQAMIDLKCEACDGKGWVDEDRLFRIGFAEGQRFARTAMKINLGDAARVRGISPAELSAIEHCRKYPGNPITEGPAQSGGK